MTETSAATPPASNGSPNHCATSGSTTNGPSVSLTTSPTHLPPLFNEPLLTPAEVAHIFRVDPKTVTRWARHGRLHPIFTLGGHRRYRESEIWALYRTTSPTGAKPC